MTKIAILKTTVQALVACRFVECLGSNSNTKNFDTSDFSFSSLVFRITSFHQFSS